jgi:hypothetical protein
MQEDDVNPLHVHFTDTDSEPRAGQLRGRVCIQHNGVKKNPDKNKTPSMLLLY